VHAVGVLEPALLIDAYLHSPSRGRVVELAMNCYGCHVLQKALDCEEDIRLLIVSELLCGDPAQSLVNKHASHVWSKVCFFLSTCWLCHVFMSIPVSLGYGARLDLPCTAYI
jgi:hypothetical protein